MVKNTDTDTFTWRWEKGEETGETDEYQRRIVLAKMKIKKKKEVTLPLEMSGKNGIITTTTTK